LFAYAETEYVSIRTYISQIERAPRILEPWFA